MSIKKKLMACLLFCTPFSYAEDVQIPNEHLNLINKWLAKIPQYRLANLDDCKCAENIQEMREGLPGSYEPKPNYLPYYAAGNFIGVPSFAALVVGKKQDIEPKILVFCERGRHFPISIKYPFSNDTSLELIGLFVKKNDNKTDDLLIGTFNSEAEKVFIPMHKK